MGWKKLSYWKRWMIIGIIFGAVLGLLDVFLLGINAEMRLLQFVPGPFQLLLVIISLPGFFSTSLLRDFVESYSVWFWFVGIAGLTIAYGLIGTIIGVVVSYYKNKPKLRKRLEKNTKKE